MGVLELGVSPDRPGGAQVSSGALEEGDVKLVKMTHVVLDILHYNLRKFTM